MALSSELTNTLSFGLADAIAIATAVLLIFVILKVFEFFQRAIETPQEKLNRKKGDDQVRDFYGHK